MEMTNNEIVSKFKRAEEKRQQISILAQLNGCNEEKIKQILIDEGIPEAEIQPVKKRRGRKPGIKNKVQSQSNSPSESIAEDERKRLPLSECNITYRTGDVLLQQQKEVNRLVDEMMELEKQLDTLVNYLNGECRP